VLTELAAEDERDKKNEEQEVVESLEGE